MDEIIYELFKIQSGFALEVWNFLIAKIFKSFFLIFVQSFKRNLDALYSKYSILI